MDDFRELEDELNSLRESLYNLEMSELPAEIYYEPDFLEETLAKRDRVLEIEEILNSFDDDSSSESDLMPF